MTTEEDVKRPPVSVFLFLWFAWLLFRIGFVGALLWGIQWEDGRVVVFPIRLGFVVIFGYCVIDTCNKPPWRIPLPERWSRR